MKSLRLILSNPRYFAPAWSFATLNILFGTWATYIPVIKEAIGLDKATLGFAIFFLSLGSFTIFPLASKLINKIGVGRSVWYGLVLICLASVLPFLAVNYYTLIAGLFFYGAANGFLDIAMNTLVTEMEKEDHQNFMSAAHGFFSLGGVIAGIGSFLILVLDNRILHICSTAVVLLIISFVLRKNYIHIISPPIEKESFNIKNFKPLFILGVISFVIMGSEGAIIDWSGIYLQEVNLAPEKLIGLGFLAFSAMMTLGRFFADGLSAKIGSVKIVILGTLLAIVGYSLVLFGMLYVTILGFALIGLGFSAIIPELFRIGGKVKGVASSQGIAFIAGTGVSGFLLGPVVLGFLAESYSLRISFMLLLVCSIMVLAASFILKRKRGV
ncbi:major facilitator superfamily MFS_1 [Cellulophaga algicola DSM 14237]|uniref:Major facilitator superfamily MFS_1 n=1 Tax=Cellulophaga algicola (strain DSM 14237 / IC166 / ACAM 630) TaxID=688270 RepID=E6X6P7_CELAD|nr:MULTISPECIES: MFS transporter [Cellulophaga]ADV49585.1 major facilitator superfamily MFS_1 [Cellulophaga algicola DSM 14237]